MPAQCPNCHHEIDCLYIERDCIETGTCDLDGDNENWDNTESCGNDSRTTCPECGEECNPDNVEYPNEEEDTERTLRPTGSVFIRQPIPHQSRPDLRKAVSYPFREIQEVAPIIVTCQKCDTKFESEYVPGDKTKECDNCHSTQELTPTSTLIIIR